MSKYPRVVLAAGLGVGIFVGVDNLVEREPQSTYAVEQVNSCVAALGDQAIKAADLRSACADYTETFVPSAVGDGDESNRTLTFKLPSPVELLKAEGGEAALIDQNIVQTNADSRSQELLLAGAVGLMIAFAFGSFKPVKKLDNLPVQKQKKSPRKPTAIKV